MNTIKLAPLLLIFAEVAKTRSFTQAAKQLGLSKGAVSQQIKRLESELEVQLLARNTRGVLLTSAGESLLARTTLLNAQLSNAIADVQLSKTQPKGVFRVAVPPFFERHIIVPALQQLCLEFPLIQPELVVTGHFHDLIENQLDAAIFGGDLNDLSYKALSIGKVRDIFCASPHYLAQYGEPETLVSLATHKYIATNWQQGTVPYYNKADKSSGEITLAQFAHTNSVSTLCDMTQSGLGIGLIPEFFAKAMIQQGKLQQILCDYTGRQWHFYMLHRYQNNKPPHLARFYQLIKHYFLNAHSY